MFVLLQQRCASKGNELRVEQTGPHKGREEVVLATVSLIDQHIEVGLGAQHPEVHLLPADLFPLGLHRHTVLIHLQVADIAMHDEEVPFLTNPPVAGRLQGIIFFVRRLGSLLTGLIALLELLHRAGEHAAVVVGQHLQQAINRHSLNGINAYRMEGIEDLLIEVFAVGQYQHGWVVQTRAIGTQHARKQGHGQRLATTLGMPDDAAHGFWHAEAIHRFSHGPPLLIAR
ncbi:hypothetical protein D3C84_808080 [compost metagenome]